MSSRKLLGLLFPFLTWLLVSCSGLNDAERLNDEGNKEKALSIAVGFLDSDEKAERLQAATWIGKIGLEKGGKPLAVRLEDSDAEVQRAVIKSLGMLAYAPASEALVNLVPKVSGETSEALGKTIRQIGDPAVEPLVEKFHLPSQKANQEKYQKMLTFVGPSVTEAIVKSMKNRSFFENKANFEVLISIKNPKVAQMMLPYIEDNEVAHVVVEGLSSLKALAVDPVIEALKKQAENKENIVIKERLIEVLGNLEDQRSVPLLESLSQDPDERVRTAVDRALYKLRGF